MKTNLISLSMILMLLFFFSCKKDYFSHSEDGIVSKKLSKEKITESMNNYHPDLDFKGKKSLLQKFAKNVEAARSSFKTSDESKPANEGRWEMETTINTYHAGVTPGNDPLIHADSLPFSVKNDSLDSSGQPVLNGDDFFEKYIQLENKVNEMNLSDTPVTLANIEISSYDADYTYFIAIITRQYGYYSNLPYVLTPEETPVPFGPTEWYFAFHHDYFPGLDVQLQAKLNHGSQFLNDPIYIIEAYAPFDVGWLTNYDPNFWHGYMNVQLNNGQCNSYLTFYKSAIDYHNPNGFNNMYIHHVWVQHHDGWTECSPPPCFPDPPNSNIYCWHYLVFWPCKVTLDPGNGG